MKVSKSLVFALMLGTALATQLAMADEATEFTTAEDIATESDELALDSIGEAPIRRPGGPGAGRPSGGSRPSVGGGHGGGRPSGPIARPGRPSGPIARPGRPSGPIARPGRPSGPIARPGRPSGPIAQPGRPFPGHRPPIVVRPGPSRPIVGHPIPGRRYRPGHIVINRHRGYWQPWYHRPYRARRIYHFNWSQLIGATCTAEDRYGYNYTVSDDIDRFETVQENMYEVENAAIDRCYYESGGDTSCHLVDCDPIYGRRYF